MARVKRGVTAHAKHKKVLEQAKGFYGRRKNTITNANAAVDRSLQLRLAAHGPLDHLPVERRGPRRGLTSASFPRPSLCPGTELQSSPPLGGEGRVVVPREE
jgi:hypothetical protein